MYVTFKIYDSINLLTLFRRSGNVGRSAAENDARGGGGGGGGGDGGVKRDVDAPNGKERSPGGPLEFRLAAGY